MGREMAALNIIDGISKGFSIGLYKLQGACDKVIDINHGHFLMLFQIAGIGVVLFKSSKEHFYTIIAGAPMRSGAGDDPRIS